MKQMEKIPSQTHFMIDIIHAIQDSPLKFILKTAC
jgi:hypothetical protein